MAIGRITGQMLSANLSRSGTDLAFETNLLVLDVTNSRVGVGTASPATTFHVSATDALRLPSGNSAQRPGSPANGDIRYNSDTGAVEGYAGGWLKMTGGTSLADADGDTQIQVERTADEDAMHFEVGGTDAAHIRANGNIELNNLQIADTTISTLSTNGDLTLTPNGTGKVIVTNGTTLQTNTADINGGAIDGTVIGANSAAAGTFTTIDTSGNATIGGNLTVNGTTTTISTTNTTVSDLLFELGTGTTGTPSNDAGIVIERGDSANAFIGFDESEDKFKVGTGTFTGSSTGNLTITTGTLVANLEGDVTGDVTGTVSDISNHLLDEDNMASDDATKAPSQQSVKAYVDAQDANIASDTLTFTNKTIDANGTGNSITNIDSGNFLSGFFLDEDNMASNDATAVASQQSIKAYVDAEDANIASDTLTFTNKTFDANGTGNSISNIDFADFTSGVVLDEDNMASDSATNLATQQSIKAYVDTEIGAVSTSSISQGNSSATISDTGSDGAFTVVADGNTELVINDTSATFSGNVIMSGNLTVNGTTTTVNTTNTTVSDNILELNSGTSSSGNDAGIIIERGSTGDNAFIGWDESVDKFTVGTTTATADDKSGGISVTTGTLVANLEATTATVGGSNVTTTDNTQTLTNKTLTSAVLNTGVSGTAILDEDNMASDSNTQLATQQSIKAYVDSQVTAQDLDFQADSGGALAIDLDSETLTFTGGTGIDTSGSGNAVTFAIDSTVTTLTGSQTLTNKTLTSPVLNTGVSGTAVLDEDNMATNSDTQLATQQSIKAYVDAEDANIASDTLTFTNKTFDANGTGNSLSNVEVADFASGEVLDEDNMASDSATKLATQQSIKAYVDAEVGAVSTSSISTGDTSVAVTDTGSDGTITITADGNTEVTINDTSATFNGNVIVSGDFTVNGTTTTIDSTTLTVEDPLIQLAKNNSGGAANAFDQGLFFNRGSLDNVSFLWDESADQFAFAVTSGEDGTTAGNITIDSYAALKAGVTTVSDLETGVISAADGTESATIANSTGVMTIASSVLTTTDINGGTVDGVTIGGASAGAGTFTNLTVNTDVDITDSGGDGTMDGVIIGGSTAAAGTFTTIGGTTATLTNAQVTNIKANDGTAAIAIADSTGAVTISTAVELDGGNVTINESSASVDFRVESKGHALALFVDGSDDHVGIKTATPAYDLDISGSTDAINLPQGNTSARPTAAAGIIRFNTQTGQYEGCQDGSTYVNFAIAGDAPTFTKESTTGDGSTSTFSGFFSSAPESANNVFVYIDNVYQEPTENYTVSGTNITFTSAPHSGARIFAITGADNTALATGGIARSESAAVSVSGSSATNIMTFNAASYRSAELFITSQDSGNTQYSAMKATVIHDGTTAYGTTYAVTNSAAGDIVDISFNHDGSNTVEVKATPLNSGTQSIKVQYSLSAI